MNVELIKLLASANAPVQSFACEQLANRVQQANADSERKSITLSYVINKITFTPVGSYHLAWETIVRSFPTVVGRGDARFARFKLKLKMYAKEFERNNKIKEAGEDSSTFVAPPGFFDRDLADLRLGSSTSRLIEVRQRSWSPDHFNLERFNAVFADLPEPDRSRLFVIATLGASIPLPEGFVRLSSPPPLRPLAKNLGNCFLKHAVKLWEAKKVLVLPLRSLSTGDLQVLHFCPGHWTPKPEVPMGRFLLDATNAENPNNVLNQADAFSVAEDIYGKLRLPSIHTIITGWVTYINENGSYQWSEMKIYKEDIKGAFSQVKINPESATLLAVLMS